VDLHQGMQLVAIRFGQAARLLGVEELEGLDELRLPRGGRRCEGRSAGGRGHASVCAWVVHLYARGSSICGRRMAQGPLGTQGSHIYNCVD